MLRVAIAAAALSFAVAGCASGGDVAPRRGHESISVKVSPCYGPCPVYTLSVAADGQVDFVGEAHTRVSGARTRTVAPSHYEAIEQALAPYKPPRSVAPCDRFVTDSQAFTVVWTDASGGTSTLGHYGGDLCPESEALSEILLGIPELAGVSDWARPSDSGGGWRR